MNNRALRSFALGAVLSLAIAGTASAGVINFSTNALGNPTPTNTSLGSTYMFAGGLTAYSGSQATWSLTCTASVPTPCLDYKYTSGDPAETGLGLIPTLNDEITYPYGIAFRTSSGYIGGFELGSVQSGESWQVLGCSSFSSTGCTVLASGIGGSASGTVTLTGLGSFAGYVVDTPCPNSDSSCNPGVVPGGSTYTGTTNSSNNILVMSATTVPEPGTLALFAAGLLGGILLVRRRARQH